MYRIFKVHIQLIIILDLFLIIVYKGVFSQTAGTPLLNFFRQSPESVSERLQSPFNDHCGDCEFPKGQNGDTLFVTAINTLNCFF